METPNDEFTGMEFQCPQCKTQLDEYQETCPQCGRELGDEFCATYRPAVPTAVRIVAGVLLFGVILVPVALVVWHLLSQALQ
jgi:hypothetical protein